MIFNLFKSKPTLKELIPDGFVDIHSHILPEIDDGAKNVEESIYLIKEMEKLGFSKIIGTPHTYPGLYNNTDESIKKSYKKISNKIPKKISLGYATEYLLDNSIIKKSRDRKLLCIKSNYVLVEMSYISEPLGLYDIIFEIVVNGYRPILAHPERYLFYNKLKSFIKLKKVGCLFQANLLSATDYYGSSVRKNLDMLLKSELLDFVGSDVHNTSHLIAFEKKISCKNTQALKRVIENNNQFS